MAKNLPEFTGTYKAMVLSNTVEPSSKAKIPTLQLRVLLTEYYDEGEGEWIDVEAEHWTMTAFLVLYSKERTPSLNHQQVCSTFGWDGCGFDLLCGPDLEGMTIQVRVKDSDSEKYPVEISWINAENADPSGGFKKKTAEEIKELNTQFKDFLDKKPVKVASAKKSGKAAASTLKGKAAAKAKAEASTEAEPEASNDEQEVEAPEEPKAMTATEKKAALLAKSKRLRKQQEDQRAKESEDAPPSKSKKSSKGRVIEAGEDMPDDFNKKDAWFTVTALRDEDCDDDMQTAEWQNAIEEIAPDADEDQLDAEGWWNVKKTVLANIGKD